MYSSPLSAGYIVRVPAGEIAWHNRQIDNVSSAQSPNKQTDRPKARTLCLMTHGDLYDDDGRSPLLLARRSS